MKEIVFLNRNVERWRNFEQILKNARATTPDHIARLYIQITDDLAYARTYYPRSKTTVYLNQLALQTHNIIYKNRPEQFGRVFNFWKYDLPLIYMQNRRYILYSFLIFFVSVLIGVVSTIEDQTFVRLILGDDYVNMTLENIEKGDPMAVYKSANETDMFLGITYNNIRVSFNMFVLGMLVSVGSAWALFQNGVMVGTFETLFYQHGLLYESVLSVWIHGTLEIWAIIVAGASGICMGNSILFTGTYTRLTSFRRGAGVALKMAVGLVPFFVVAGFLEGFVTRHDDSSQWVRLAIILGSLAFIVWYFFIYPQRVNRILISKLNKEIII